MDELSARTAENRARAKGLARQLAQTADRISRTFDRAADVHEAVSADADHPLVGEAEQHAAAERAFARHERREAQRLRALADDD
jgi:hypothetical protein